MADGFVQVPPDSTGKQVDTRTAPDGNHRQVVAIGDPDNVDVAQVDATLKALKVLLMNTTALNVAVADATASGSIAANGQSVEISLTGQEAIGIQLTGTFVGTIQPQATIDGTNWVAMSVGIILSNLTTFNNLTTTGIYLLRAAGFTKIRLIATAWTSGTAVISMRASSGAAFPFVSLLGGAQALGSVSVSALSALIAGTALVGDVGQQYRANATGAASRAHLVAAASVNATIVKASAGRLIGWSFVNPSAAWKYIKLHNQATTPTAGASVFMTIGVPPGGRSDFDIEGGIAFTTGIGLTTVTGSADTDTTAVTAGDLVGDLFFA